MLQIIQTFLFECLGFVVLVLGACLCWGGSSGFPIAVYSPLQGIVFSVAIICHKNFKWHDEIFRVLAAAMVAQIILQEITAFHSSPSLYTAGSVFSIVGLCLILGGVLRTFMSGGSQGGFAPPSGTRTTANNYAEPQGAYGLVAPPRGDPSAYVSA